MSANDSAARTREATSTLAKMRSLDNGRAFLAIGIDYAIIAATVAIALRLHHPLVDLAAMIVVAGRQVAFLNLVHAASHAALFRTRAWNRALQFLFASPILDAVDIYRGPHLEHHQAITENSDDRFEFLHDELSLLQRGAFGRIWIVLVRPILGHATWSFCKTTVASLRRHKRDALGIGLYWAVVISVCAALGGLKPLLLYWVVPLFWLHPVFLLWGEVSDHFGAPSGTRNHLGLFHAALTNGHALYHDVHHRFPFVPFYGERAAFDWLRAHGHDMETATSALDLLSAIYRPKAVVAPTLPYNDPIEEMNSATSAS